MASDSPSPKIGQGQPLAMGRLGLKELGQALTALPDSIRVIEEPGMFGNPVPQEIFAQKQAAEPEVEQSQDMFMDYGMDMEMEM